MYGLNTPEPLEIRCPECKELLGNGDQITTLKGSDTVTGCTQCLTNYDVFDWFMDEQAKGGVA